MAEQAVIAEHLANCDAAIRDLNAQMREVVVEDPVEYACLRDGIDELLDERLDLTEGLLPSMAQCLR